MNKIGKCTYNVGMVAYFSTCVAALNVGHHAAEGVLQGTFSWPDSIHAKNELRDIQQPVQGAFVQIKFMNFIRRFLPCLTNQTDDRVNKRAIKSKGKTRNIIGTYQTKPKPIQLPSDPAQQQKEEKEARIAAKQQQKEGEDARIAAELQEKKEEEDARIAKVSFEEQILKD